ncbi:hypothetical protein CL616_01220 [archaeon]|nr:hypothetical protein [archaeon]
MDEEDNAKGELKRVDHLIYVTLKYTRTVDVIRNIIEKLISTLNHKSNDIFLNLLDNKKVSSVPSVPLVRMKDLEKQFSKDKKVKDIVDFYILLKKIYNADYRAKEEYRKNVTLVTREKEVNIEMLKNYYELTQDYVEHLNTLE